MVWVSAGEYLDLLLPYFVDFAVAPSVFASDLVVVEVVPVVGSECCLLV